jgi:hypothetical protein
MAVLTNELGLKEAALAAHSRVMSVREALAAERGAGNEIIVDLGRSLAAVAHLHWDAGRADEAEKAFLASEARLAEALRAQPSDASLRVALGESRAKLGELLADRGRTREALDMLGRARSDLELPSGSPGRCATPQTAGHCSL